MKTTKQNTMKQMPVLSHADFGEVRGVIKNGEPWFVAKDICDVLGLTNSRKATATLDEDEKEVTSSYTPGGQQEMAIVNESGLYSLIMQSRKPAAKAFRKWVTSEVLPSIRKYGFYAAPDAQLTRKQREAMEKTYYTELKKYITGEDKYRIAKRFRVKEYDVANVLSGFIKNNDIMRALQERAIANKENWEDAYAAFKMDEIVTKLK